MRLHGGQVGDPTYPPVPDHPIEIRLVGKPVAAGLPGSRWREGPFCGLYSDDFGSYAGQRSSTRCPVEAGGPRDAVGFKESTAPMVRAAASRPRMVKSHS